MKVILLPKDVWGSQGIQCYNNIAECYPHKAFFIECEMSVIPHQGDFIILSEYKDMIFKQLFGQLANENSEIHLLLKEARMEDNRTPTYLHNLEKLDDKQLLRLIVYGNEEEPVFNEGMTDFRWRIEEIAYQIGYQGEDIFITISHTYT